VALGTEGGHTSFAPRDEREIGILRYALTQYDHVSFERLLSGPGMELIHRALEHRDGLMQAGLAAPEITRRALEQGDARCLETLEVFCLILGTAASNLAVVQGAFGGIFIGGGIVPRLGGWFDTSAFRARFEEKGRFSGYLRAIPTYVITSTQATLEGAAAILAAQLRGLESAQGSAILGQIQRARPTLSPAERRVADLVLAQPRSTLNDPIATIAKAAQVSQPTVIRFCRSLGCEGLSDFKLRLASGLTGTIPVMHTQVTGEDSMLELGAKVLDNTASSILQLRDQLNRDTIDRAVELLTQALRVEFHAVGHYGAVADDAQFKFLRLGVPSASYTDARLQRLAAGVMQPRDVAVLISSSGRTDDLLAVADAARERGAAVIAITEGNSPLARRADVALIVDHVEDVTTHVPMVSRILHLLVIDILAVGLSMRRGHVGGVELPERAAVGLDESGGEPRAAPVPLARRIGPGISTAAPPTARTSHSR
jgi:glucokinase